MPRQVPVNTEAEPALSDNVRGPIQSVEGADVSAHNPNSPDAAYKIGSKVKPNTVTAVEPADAAKPAEKATDDKATDKKGEGKEAAPAEKAPATKDAAAPPKAGLVQMTEEPCEPALDVSQ